MGSRASSVRNSPESRMFLKMKNAFSGICDARMSAGVVGRPAFPEGQGLSGSEVFWQSRFRIADADAKDGEKLSGVPERELPVVLVADTEGVSVREPESAKGVVVSHSFSADGDGLYFAVQAQECLAVFNTENIVGSVEDSGSIA